MRVWEVVAPGPVDGGPLAPADRSLPEPGPGEVRIRVSVCGVCRTDLHVAEGDLPVHRERVVPGHEVVGRVEACGDGVGRFAVGDRVGAAWLASTCGVCRFCRRGQENLCLHATFNGWDRDGGYAEAMVVDERFAYRVPEGVPDEKAAPLLCAGSTRSPTGAKRMAASSGAGGASSAAPTHVAPSSAASRRAAAERVATCTSAPWAMATWAVMWAEPPNP